MSENKKRRGKLDADSVTDLPNNKPVVYKLLNKKGDNIYTGVAKRGRVDERLAEHMRGAKDAIPGAVRVEITQHPSIAQAKASEERIIKRSQPRHNKQHK